jgi:hypothetical protein
LVAPACAAILGLDDISYGAADASLEALAPDAPRDDADAVDAGSDEGDAAARPWCLGLSPIPYTCQDFDEDADLGIAPFLGYRGTSDLVQVAARLTADDGGALSGIVRVEPNASSSGTASLYCSARNVGDVAAIYSVVDPDASSVIAEVMLRLNETPDSATTVATPVMMLTFRRDDAGGPYSFLALSGPDLSGALAVGLGYQPSNASAQLAPFPLPIRRGEWVAVRLTFGPRGDGGRVQLELRDAEVSMDVPHTRAVAMLLGPSPLLSAQGVPWGVHYDSLRVDLSDAAARD